MKHLVRFIQAITYICGVIFFFFGMLAIMYMLAKVINPDFVITL